jgi:protein tyrosine/serine phosphatase
MRRTLPPVFLFLLLPVSLSAQTNTRAFPPSVMQSASGQKLQITGIHNAGKITDVLYRGAQPDEHGLSELKKMGITTIIDLRGEDREKVEWERQRAESLGMRFVHIPVSGWSAPTDQQVSEFLAVFRGDPQQKIFVHCLFGSDRTGVFVATYRMAFEQWPADLAMKEMYFFGFKGTWHPSMKSFVREFPARLNSSPDLAPVRALTSQP